MVTKLEVKLCHLVNYVLVRHWQKNASMVEVGLYHRPWLVPKLIMKRGQVKEGPAHTIVKVAAGVAGTWEHNPPVQPQSHCTQKDEVG